MKVQIKKFSTHQTAKVLAILFTVPTLLYVPVAFLLFILPFIRPVQASPDSDPIEIIAIILLFVPALYFVVAYLFTRLGLWIYNIVASRLGGIEFEYEPCDDDRVGLNTKRDIDDANVKH